MKLYDVFKDETWNLHYSQNEKEKEKKGENKSLFSRQSVQLTNQKNRIIFRSRGIVNVKMNFISSTLICILCQWLMAQLWFLNVNDSYVNRIDIHGNIK